MSAPKPRSKRSAGNKTQANDADVSDFLNSIEHEQRRHDAVVLIDLMESITGFKPKMWGQSIIGFDQYHYKYDSGREGDLCLVGFSPRARALSLYIMPGFSEFDHLLDILGKFRKGKSCLYINKLADVDLEVLSALIRSSVAIMRRKYHS